MKHLILFLLAALLLPACSNVPVLIGGPEGEVVVDWTVQDNQVSHQVAHSELTAVGTQEHAEFDRVIFDFDRAIPPYSIMYVDSPQYECGSGNPVFLDGDGWLQIHFAPSSAHTTEGRPHFTPNDFRTDYENLLQLEMICDFEGNVTYILAVNSPNEFRVTEDDEWVIVDIRH